MADSWHLTAFAVGAHAGAELQEDTAELPDVDAEG